MRAADVLAAAPGPGDLRPPVAFGGTWTVLGVVLVLLAVVLVAAAVRRPRATPEPVETPQTLEAPAPARTTTLADLEDLEREARAGSLSPRDVGHRTADLLRAAGTPAASAAVAVCAPWQFRPRPPQDTEPLLRAARAALDDGGAPS